MQAVTAEVHRGSGGEPQRPARVARTRVRDLQRRLNLNLDRDQPISGLAPETEAELVRRALQEEWTPDALGAELTARAERHAAV